MNNYFDKVLHKLGKEKKHPNIIIIGAMDGVSFDEMRGYIDMYSWREMLLVEPIPEMFERLQASYDNGLNNKYENSAIMPVNGPVEMIRIPPDIVDAKLVHECFNGMSAVYPPRNGLGSEGDRATVEKYSERVTVDGITLDRLFEKHKITNFDILSIDAEGCDWDIIQQLDLTAYTPTLIRCEYINLNASEQKEMEVFFENGGYYFEITGQNLDAVKKTYWDEMNKPIVHTQNPSSLKTPIGDNLTIVTGLFDIGRGDIKEGFSREFSHYIECFKVMLEVNLPMIIYTTKDLDSIIWDIRDKHNTHIVHKTVDDIKNFPFYSKVNEIRQNAEWINRSGWIADSPQASLDLYNPLVMSKQFWLNDATYFNNFNTDYFLWVDAGLSNTIGDPKGYINKAFAKNVVKRMNKMLYVCFPYEGTVEVHGFEKRAMNGYAGEDTKYVARGGVFGGSKHAINEVNEKYYDILSSTLEKGLMGTEESIFTILSYAHKNLVNLHMIDSNGLVFKFFDDMKTTSEHAQNVEEQLAIYVLTFNLPKQFELWAQSFKKAYPSDFSSTKKYVINNSMDDEVVEEYNRLFEQYGFTEFKFDNIGICDGRQYAAEHFSQSGHEYMVFFEDDMLLHDGEGRCKNGFTTHQPNLFNKSMSIMEDNELSYLKLSFSEFFGDNHDNWASYNIPEMNRTKYFPERADGVSNRKVNIDYTGVHVGLSYAVGFYHYCNWPLMFNQDGNTKVFLDTVYEHKFEQTWMSHVMNLQWDNKIKAGCLLASPINHSRVFHYGKASRRENKHYEN